MVDELIKIYDRDIDRLQYEIETFDQEDNLWKTMDGISNSAGNLCLHLIGNLRTYIGKNMGNFSYTRNRDAEFNSKDIPKQKLIEQIDETKHIVLGTLRNLEAKKLEENHLEDVLGFKMTNRFFLIHLAAHLSYHLGQINYLRRILEKN
ncbi:DinB family protein [Pontibacter cellulosilyticus]|uniref:DUF1572 family protein n=1 Tax=Pontibacter cellulosilyticus TaxID=1720253 RepID=A0A923SMN9_9BACT|nr:DUF1572 family protein [Pontibacter cellulosilyticus]MBC5992380.1 DUF1572 family protein [Pontibacter cellulosilyticus]